jgi:hypothetical protein
MTGTFLPDYIFERIGNGEGHCPKIEDTAEQVGSGDTAGNKAARVGFRMRDEGETLPAETP